MKPPWCVGLSCAERQIHGHRVGADIHARLAGQAQLIRVTSPDRALALVDHRQVLLVGVPPRNGSGGRRDRWHDSRMPQRLGDLVAPGLQLPLPRLTEGEQGELARGVVDHQRAVDPEERRGRIAQRLGHGLPHGAAPQLVAEPSDPAEAEARGIRFFALFIRAVFIQPCSANRCSASPARSASKMPASVRSVTMRARRRTEVASRSGRFGRAVEPERVLVGRVQGLECRRGIDRQAHRGCEEPLAHTLSL